MRYVRVLILGGTGEARELAAQLHGRSDVDVISSLAGRVGNPRLPPGQVRIGGFDGVAGLVEYLRSFAVDLIVDCTHPFAAAMTSHAVEAAAVTRCPLLLLRRPGWSAGPGDDWTRVPDLSAAAAHVAALPAGVVFLTTGRRDLSAFAHDAHHEYLVRTVDPPTGSGPPRMTLLLDRGPYPVEAETALMRDHGVAVLVTKDSGGAMTAGKLEAARRLRIRVVMVDRPALPPGIRTVSSVNAALRACSELAPPIR